MARKKLDLVGKTFGDARVIAEAGKSARGAILWRCECLRCGSEFVVEGQRLTAKHRPRKDCGCSQRDRSQDLSGKTFGGIEVIRREGSYKSGDKMYVCRCLYCGREKLIPACTIRSNPQSCGCISYSFDRMQQIGLLGAEKTHVDGVNVYCAARTTPNGNNLTGYRWVRVTRRKGKEFIFAVFFVGGKRHYKGGFASLESAYRWAEREHRIAVEMTGVKLPGEEGQSE